MGINGAPARRLGLSAMASLALVATTVTGWAHDAPTGFRYPESCCSPDHLARVCRQVRCNEISEKDNGSFEWQSLLFGNGQVHDSPDANCHACAEEHEGVPSHGYCLLLPNNNAAIARWAQMYEFWRK